MGFYDYRHAIANEQTCFWFILPLAPAARGALTQLWPPTHLHDERRRAGARFQGQSSHSVYVLPIIAVPDVSNWPPRGTALQ